ncbi:hypothetical protein VNO77_05058 [Canavalia gladiata]|uniref:Uncharacterized protein n=1 Tax=Canavalia gladiata TaxID=3824 RepID=A0AAN9N463_CANGL
MIPTKKNNIYVIIKDRAGASEGGLGPAIKMAVGVVDAGGCAKTVKLVVPASGASHDICSNMFISLRIYLDFREPTSYLGNSTSKGNNSDLIDVEPVKLQRLSYQGPDIVMESCKWTFFFCLASQCALDAEKTKVAPDAKIGLCINSILLLNKNHIFIGSEYCVCSFKGCPYLNLIVPNVVTLAQLQKRDATYRKIGFSYYICKLYKLFIAQFSVQLTMKVTMHLNVVIVYYGPKIQNDLMNRKWKCKVL